MASAIVVPARVSARTLKRKLAGDVDSPAESTVQYVVTKCSLGTLLVAGTERGVCCVLLGESVREVIEDLQGRFACAVRGASDSRVAKWAAQIASLADKPSAAKLKASAVPLDVRGTAFQRRVWRALGEISCGETRTYAEVAAAIGRPLTVRAVANACGANPTGIVVPCHRVVRSDGGLGGYYWGVERKAKLLAAEGAR